MDVMIGGIRDAGLGGEIGHAARWGLGGGEWGWELERWGPTTSSLTLELVNLSRCSKFGKSRPISRVKSGSSHLC